MLGKSTLKTLLDIARAMTGTGAVSAEAKARRAFELAHRAQRLCELAGEHASRNRWNLLLPPAHNSRDGVQRFAQKCAAVVIRYPVQGEAAVYAALLTAADCAREVANVLYQAWLDTQSKKMKHRF